VGATASRSAPRRRVDRDPPAIRELSRERLAGRRDQSKDYDHARSLGLDSRYERANDAFCAIVGYTREQLVGLPRAPITHPDDVAADVPVQVPRCARRAMTLSIARCCGC
jgi:PAS domain-containing protein